jgi:hypothetical protein
MTDNAEKLSGKVGLDTTDFKTGLAAMNRELRVVESGFRASAAALGDWSNDASGLEMRIKALTSSIGIQQQKVAAVRAEYERVKIEKGENSRAAQDLEIKLNKETESLGKMENELGQTETSLAEMKSSSNEAGDSVEQSGDQAEAAGGKWSGFKTTIAGVVDVAKFAGVALLGLITIAVATGAAVVGLTLHSAQAADDLATLSVQTGINTTTLQEMKYAGDQLGFTLDTFTGANTRLIRSMASALAGTGAQADAFKQLGISVTNADGTLRSSQDVFDDTITALGDLTNPAERDALAMTLMGKSAQELNPLIKAGSDELARLSEEAHKNGAVVSTETVGALAGLQDQLDGLKGGLQGVGMNIAAAFAPFFSGALGQAQGYLQQLVGIVSGSGGDFGKMAEGLAGLFGTIATDIAAQAPQMLTAGLAIVQAILKAIMSALPTMLKAGIEIIKSLVGFIVANLPMLLDAGIQILLMLVTTLIENLPMLIDAAIQAIITLSNGLTQALPTLIPAIVQAIITIVNALLENLPMLVTAALQLILALAQGLILALPVLIAAIPEIMRAIVDALIVAIPMILEAAYQLIVMLATALIGGAPDMGKAGMEMINGLINQIKQMDANIKRIGRQIVEGVWQGIQAATSWFYGLIYDFFAGMVSSVLDALGISSPSKVFAEIGKQTMRGFTMGFEREFSEVEKQLARSMGGLGLTLNPAIAGASAGMGGTTNQSSIGPFFAPVIIQGQQSPDSLGAAIKGKRF